MPPLLRITIMTEMMPDTPSVLPLFIWLSPSFPIGLFAYSHGCEQAVEVGDIKNADDLRLWLEASLLYGSVRVDAILFVQAWQAMRNADMARLAEVNELALALCPSAERYLETTAQGNAFVRATAKSWSCSARDALAKTQDHIAYLIAVGMSAAHYSCPLALSLNAFLYLL